MLDSTRVRDDVPRVQYILAISSWRNAAVAYNRGRGEVKIAALSGTFPASQRARGRRAGKELDTDNVRIALAQLIASVPTQAHGIAAMLTRLSLPGARMGRPYISIE